METIESLEIEKEETDRYKEKLEIARNKIVKRGIISELDIVIDDLYEFRNKMLEFFDEYIEFFVSEKNKRLAREITKIKDRYIRRYEIAETDFSDNTIRQEWKNLVISFLDMKIGIAEFVSENLEGSMAYYEN